MIERSVTEWIRLHLLANLPGVELTQEQRDVLDPSFDAVRAACRALVTDAYLVERLASRLHMGFYRYLRGVAHPRRVRNVGYDAVGDALQRCQQYQATGNREWLLDAMNMLLLEWWRPEHPQAHWAPQDRGA